MHFFFPAQAFQLTFIPTCHIVTFKKRYRKKIQTHKDIANLAQCSAFFFFWLGMLLKVQLKQMGMSFKGIVTVHTVH